MTKTQARDGHRRFIELAKAIGDEATLNRIRHGLHPFRNEFIEAEDWPLADAA